MQEAWRDAGNVVVLEHVASDALYEDYSMVFGNFHTFKADVKLSAAKFYYELEIKHIQGIARFGWATEGFESSTESTGEGVGDNAGHFGLQGGCQLWVMGLRRPPSHLLTHLDRLSEA